MLDVAFAVRWQWRGRAPPGPREGLSPPPLSQVLRCWTATTTVFRRAGTRAPDSVRRGVMSRLPDRPDTDQLPRQARELHRAAAGGDTSALGLLRQVSDKVTLSAAQLAIARDYGFPSWPRLQAEAERRRAGAARPAPADPADGPAPPVKSWKEMRD